MLIDPEGWVSFQQAEQLYPGDTVMFPTGWATVRQVTYTGALGEVRSVAVEGQNQVQLPTRRREVTMRVNGVRMRMVVPLTEQIPVLKPFERDTLDA